MTDQSDGEIDHPLEDELGFSDGVTAEELLTVAEDRVSTGLLESGDPRLAEVSFTFVDNDGVMREWSTSSSDFDRDAYEEADDA